MVTHYQAEALEAMAEAEKAKPGPPYGKK